MACVWCYRKFDRSENYRGVHRTVKSHTDEKYRKSYLRTRVRNDRKITLLMKEHPHKFGHTASWSCIAIVDCKQHDRRALLWYPSFGTTHANALLRAQ